MTWKRGSRLKLVSEAEASPPIRAIFDEVRHSLGVSAVPILYQAYAAVPRFLELHWEALRPALNTRAFFRMGERLAAEAYTRAQSYFAIPDLRAQRERGFRRRIGDRLAAQRAGVLPVSRPVACAHHRGADAGV